MDDKNKKKWLIKDNDGRVRGPFFTDEILKKISNGEYIGEEKISLYPGTNWVPISREAEFYDKLLEILDSEHISSDSSRARNEDKPNDIVEEKDQFKVEISHSQPEKPKQTINRVERVRDNNFQERSSSKTKEEVSDKKSSNIKEEIKVPKDIELKKRKKLIKTSKAKKVSLPMALAIASAALATMYFISSIKTSGQKMHLLAPNLLSAQNKLAPEVVKQKSQNALSHFVKDTYSNYLSSQDELVQILEGDQQNLSAMSLTCLNYLELWPYSYQDSADLETISKVALMSSRKDSASIENATCRTVDLIVRGKFDEAKGVAEMVLDTFGRTGKPPVTFYYIKALLFDASKDFKSAISYAQSAEQLWPEWLKIGVLQAGALVKAGRYNEASNKYREILKKNSNHKIARIELGLLEYNYLHNYQDGKKFLEVAMGIDEKAPGEVMSRGYLGLAEIALREQNKSKALEYAQKSYALNSADLRSKEIIISIGGDKKLKETRVQDTQLVYEGDQLLREGDCNAAQAYYKTAYEINKKNGLAAMKASECLWQLSLSFEAISWLENAIKADPKLIDAYVLMADFYSQRYNFTAAGQILNKANTQSPNNYKIFRGLALIEFRRRNFNDSASYAEKAIKLYEADLESYIILAKALLGSRNFVKAFTTASKATELDMNNKQGQIVYAEALAATRGIHIGIDYLNKMTNTYPTAIDYRIALGDMYFKDQRYDYAEQVYTQVVKMADKPKLGFIKLGNTQKLLKKSNEARDSFFKAAALDPSDVEPLFLVGQLYLETKQPSEARQQFQRVLNINKEYPLVNYNIGLANLQMGLLEDTLEQANIEKLKNPNLADPYILAADAYTAMKQYSACAGEYQQAVKYRPSSSDLFIKIARCYRMAGNLDAAVSMINQASSLESGNAEVWKEQAAIYEMKQDRIKAIEAYNQYKVLAPNAPDIDQVDARINALSGGAN